MRKRKSIWLKRDEEYLVGNEGVLEAIPTLQSLGCAAENTQANGDSPKLYFSLLQSTKKNTYWLNSIWLEMIMRRTKRKYLVGNDYEKDREEVFGWK